MIQTANNRLWLVPLFLTACFSAVGADPQVKAGGVVLTLPAPASDFEEVGDKLRTTFFELLAPSTNRLLTAYVPAQTLVKLNTSKVTGGLEVYGMVEVVRQAEYLDFTPQAFQEVLKNTDPALSQFDRKKIGEVEEEMNTRLKSLRTGSIEIGRPQMLGVIFQKTNAAAIAMLTAYKQGTSSVTVACGLAILRLRQRLVFVYLFHKYESPDNVTWLRKNLEVWVDAILAKNK